METLLKNPTEILIDNNIEIDYSTALISGCEGYVKEINVKVFHIDEDEVRVEVGSVRVTMLQHLFGADYETLHYYCDGHSGDLINAFTKVFKPDGDKSRTKFYLDDFNRCIYIELFKMSEEKRGLGIGNAVIKDIIDTLGIDDTLYIVEPCAIEDKSNKVTQKRVENFWTNLNFKKIGRSEYYSLYKWY